MVNIKDIQVSDEVKEKINKIASDAFKKAGITSREAAFDDKKFNMAVGIAYKLLPMPVRLIVKKDRFKGLMFNMRETLFSTQEQ